ncbi:hypothetical protein ACJJTC_010889 [Scirpophaga incertulas]
MALEMQPEVASELQFNPHWIEQIVLQLADAFDVRVLWNNDTAIMTGVLAMAGGIVGGYAGGRVGAALGAGLAGATSLGVCILLTLRELWDTVKENLKELLYIVFNYLRRLDPYDYVRAFDILMAGYSSRRELVVIIVDIVAQKLGRQVISAITAA